MVVYHPKNSTYGHAFANVGFSGWIGSITGVSSRQMSVSEIGVSFPDETFGKESRFGTPFTVLLRDILQFDNTISEALDRIKNANRTCDLILGVGDAKSSAVRGIQYSHDVANVYDDSDMKPVNSTWHPLFHNTVYWGMDWLCPNYSQVLANQIGKYHGKLDAETMLRQVTSIVQTGDLHVAVNDLSDMITYVSFADKTGKMFAYDGVYTKLDMNELFAEKL